MDQPLRKAMGRLDAAGRMIQWAVELSQFVVDYRPRIAIKVQALADFVAEFTTAEQGLESEHWTIHTDGSAALGIGRVVVILSSLENDVIKYGVRLQFLATNNEAEYEAVLMGLRVAKAIGVRSLTLNYDSKLVTGQLNNEYEAKEDRMKRYMTLVNQLISNFDDVKIIQVPQEENSKADEVARLASSDTSKRRPDLLLEVQYLPSIEGPEISYVHSEESWMDPIVIYIKTGSLPSDPVEARKVKIRSSRFTILNDELYKRGFSQPYLKCLGPKDAEYVLREIHKGVCRSHSGPRSLVSQVVRAGYFWPTMQKDWVEAEPLAVITEAKIQHFVLKNIVCRFGIPCIIISDNGRQFDNRKFRDFCKELGIKNHYSSPGHPQVNGQTKVTNRTLLKLIKTRLEGEKGAWPDELPAVLWAYRTMTKTPTGETPFRMTFVTEAVILVEIGISSIRKAWYDEKRNDKGLKLALD
nr:uncharacterized protein LOC111988732 [Quercus suber]